MREIRLHAPERRGREVHFGWRVEPETSLYRRTHFRLRFPEEVGIASLPDALWWRVLLLCLHLHWVLLRPCRVRLPVSLEPGERAFWERLLASDADTLERLGGRFPREPVPELACAGPALGPIAAPPMRDRFATAVSGGKDGLVQAGLLAELTRDPVLVAVTSPLPGLGDHESARRRRIFDALAARRDLRFVEVESDFRSAWRNDFAVESGVDVAVNELSDTGLYAGALLAAGLALGAANLSLASENEVSENAVCEGRLVQHPHFAYGGVVQGALGRLLARDGLAYGSLVSALHSSQVQELLVRRYPELRGLQYSCWRARGRRGACSRCSQCLRLALQSLRLGGHPAEQGVRLAKLLASRTRFDPEWRPPAPDTPDARVRERLHRQTLRACQQLPPARVLRALAAREPWELLHPRGWRALARYRDLHARARTLPPEPAPGYRRAYLALAPAALREGLERVFAAHFAAEPEAEHAAAWERTRAAAAWIAAPLAGSEGPLPNRV